MCAHSVRALSKSALQERGKRDTWNAHEGEGQRTSYRQRDRMVFDVEL